MNAPTPASLDPTFYRSPAEAAAAPPEKLAYLVAFDRAAARPDALVVIDVEAGSPRYGQIVGWADLPTLGDELHHFGWNACSSALAHEGHEPRGLQRRYLLLPGLRSSNVHVYDTYPDPASPTLVKTITAKELGDKAGYSRPHTLHCGPDGIFLSCLGGADADGPGGIALLDHSTFDVVGPWETDRGPQYLSYDAWWHLRHNTLITSEWGTPSMVENGVNPELLLGNKYGHALHFWDLAAGKHLQRVDLGAHHQMVLELRPAHNPEAAWGFVGVVVSTQDLSASVWRWHRDNGTWTADKVITIPPEPADPEALPPALKPFAAVPPLIRTSTWRSMTASCMCPAGAPGSSSSTTSLTPRTRGRPARCGWAASSTALPIPPPPTYPWQGRRWSKSAGTAEGCISPTRFMGPGTISSTPTAWAPGWLRSMRTPPEGSAWTRVSSRTATSSGGCGLIRCGCKGAMRRRTPTATPSGQTPPAAPGGPAARQAFPHEMGNR